ncbi:MAG: hypothetical protein L0Y38_11390 [Methylococcaceae bacterium]|nr:hypothetical protein [Methylococcaceae bacterium]MCI0734404.1 hypothetical protein [Methylococcaceae bacterium]
MIRKLSIVVVPILIAGAAWALWSSWPSGGTTRNLVLTGSSPIAPLAAEIGKENTKNKRSFFFKEKVLETS